ncbi:YgaP family membrane protein [Salinibaculum rarum]|uniref:YgaP family membrane protein n=1 Tax=Salinibaculum rarum TaxID=3058903 RepID=UPI00265DC437|nr:DUF2892 domain-containing protein [Salinibaculum sp. KK48]
MASLNPVPEQMRNVGGYDRLARVLLGVVLFAIAVGAAVTDRQLFAVFGMIASAGLLLNAATQFCGVNAVLGLDTCAYEAEND